MVGFSGSKALSIIDNVAPKAAGTLGFFAIPMADGRGVSKSTLDFMIARILLWRFPNLKVLWNDILNTPAARDNIIGGGLASIGIPLAQSLLKQFGIPLPSTLNSALSTIKKIAVNACLGGTAGALAWLPGNQTYTSASPSQQAVWDNPPASWYGY